GLLSNVFLIFIGMVLMNEIFWKSEEKQNFLLNLQIIAGSISYFLVPLVIVLVMKKRGVKKSAST
ncbi:spore gernimation protein, partial [Butyricicoccus sp. 1XD8-22]